MFTTQLGDPAANNVSLTVNLPGNLVATAANPINGLIHATPLGTAGTCANAVAATTGPTPRTIQITNLQVPGNGGTCTVEVNVVPINTGPTGGNYNPSCATNPADFTLTDTRITVNAPAGNVTVPAFSSCVIIARWPLLESPADRFFWTSGATPPSTKALGCTANDVSLGNINVVGTTQCVSGLPVTLSLTSDITTTSTDRYDIGIFLSQDGKSLLPTSTNGGAASASSVTLSTAATGIFNTDLDKCLDTKSSTLVTGYALPLFTITCVPNPVTGNLDLQTLVSWDNTSGNNCGGPQDTVPNTTPKCTAGVSPTQVAVLGQINITKATSPAEGAAGPGLFDFTAANTTNQGVGGQPTPTAFQLHDTQTQLIQTAQVKQGGEVYLITEPANPDYTLTNITCTDAAGLPTPGQLTAPAWVTLNLAQGTVSATISTVNSILNCTYTNTLKPTTVTLTKTWVDAVTGDTTTLTLSGAGLSNIVAGSSTAPSTTTNATADATVGSTVNIAEVLGVGNKGSYTTTVACVDSLSNPVTVTSGSFTMPSKSVTCTFTNTNATNTIALTKAWVNAVNGDTTALSITGAQVSGAVGGTSTAPSTTTPATATAVSGSQVTISEVLGGGNAGAYTQDYACTSNGSPVTLTGQSFTMPTTPVSCTVTNTGSSTGVSLTKVWVNAVIGDSTSLTISGPQVSNASGGSSTAPSTTTNATANAVAGSTVTIAEGLTGGNLGAYTTTVACTSNGAPVTVTNNTFTMPANPVNCTFTNTGVATTVTLTKSWINAVIGDTTALTISGPQVSGATGGSSTAPSTTTPATATAVAGSTVTVSELLGAGNAAAYTPSLVCTSNGSPVTVTNGSFTMPATPVSCTITNTGAVAGVTLTKTWVNAVIGDTASLTIAGAQVSGAVGGTSTAPATTTDATATAVVGSQVTVSEAFGGANKATYTPSLSCTSNGAPVVFANNTFTMPATPVTCTFTNTGTTTAVSLTKVWVNAVTGDTTTLTISGAQVSGATPGSSTAPATTTDATATAVTGSTVSVSEVLGGTNKATYTQSLVCTTNGAPVTVVAGSFTAPGTPVACTITNTGSTSAITLTKVWVNAVNGDTTALTISGAQVSGAVGGTSTAPSTTTPATATAVSGSTVNVAETLGGANAGIYTQSVACTTNGTPVTVTNGNFTAPSTPVSCTITNTGTAAAVTLTKVWAQSVAGDTTTLTISGTQVSGAVGGTSTAPSTTTPATATAVTGSTVNLAELLGAGNVGTYNTTLACTSNGSPVTVTNSSITMPATAVTCTFTNTGLNAGVTLTKVWVNATVGDTTALSITGPQVTGAVAGSSTAPSTTTPATASAAIGSTVTLAETLGGANLGVYTTTLACTSNGSPVTVTNNSFTMPATAVSCTFTNTQAATTVTLTKVFTGAANGQAVNLTLSGGSGAAATPGSATVGGATTPATAGVRPGDTITLTEAFTTGVPANYNTSLSCTNSSGQLTYTGGALTGSLTIVGADVGKTIACTYTNAGKATLTKAFAPTTINVGGTTVLTFTITNPAANNPAQQFSFTDTLPSGLQIASTPGVVNNCGATVGATAGGTTITVTNGTVAASTASSTSCTIQVNVTNAPLQVNPTCPAANFTNTSGSIGGVVNLINGVQDSCVVVNPLTPTLTKGFNPTSINIGGIAQLIFTVTNPAGNPALSTVGFTDTLPSGLMVANSTVSGTCANAAAATSAPASGSTITVTGLQVPAGASSCTVVVNVTNQPGQANPSCNGNPPAFTNTAGNVTVTNVTNGIQPSCLVVNTFSFSITKTPSVSIAPPGSPLSFTIVITNNGPAPADGSIITDPAIANYTVNDPVVCVGTTGGATCPTPLTVAALQGSGMTVATFPAGATITLRIDGTSTLTSGSLINTVTVSPPAGIPGVASASASAVVGVVIGVIPTLSLGSLIVLMLTLAGLAAVVYRRRATE